MNIYTVRDNLIRTVRAKEEAWIKYKDIERSGKGDISTYAVMQFLEISLDELYGILADVQICCKQATDQSWVGVDRQGGI